MPPDFSDCSSSAANTKMPQNCAIPGATSTALLVLQDPSGLCGALSVDSNLRQVLTTTATAVALSPSCTEKSKFPAVDT